MPARDKRTPRHPTIATTLVTLCAALLITLATGASEEVLSVSASSPTSTPASVRSSSNFGCPADCQCVPVHNAHRPFLHAKCTSITDLRSDKPLQATLPIHSIDLSYLGLARISHSLEKLHDLTSVDLSHNELHEVGHLGRRIKKLNLKNNRITSAKLLKLPQHVQVLNLQHNDITYLPLELTRLMQLQTLELSHNPINCSCETLEVRNWLQLRHVFMEHPVKCSYPAEAKGKPWLQIKQVDICDKEKRGWYADALTDENELMLGDQPHEDSTMVHDNDEDEDELGQAFMPVQLRSTKSVESALMHDVEGSGDLGAQNQHMELAVTVETPISYARMSDGSSTASAQADQGDEDDGSGSGDGMLVVPHVARGPLILDDFDQPDSQEQGSEGAPSPDIFGRGMGIFHGDDASQSPVEEDEIVPDVDKTHLAEPKLISEMSTEGIPNVTTEGAAYAAGVVHAEASTKDDSKATYFLLGVLVLIVVGLIMYVGIKRCKKNQSAAADAENQRSTELLDMDKNKLGKTMQRNGNNTEHAPLIGEKTRADLARPINGAAKSAYDAKDLRDGPATQQPLLNANGNSSLPAEPKSTAIEVPRTGSANASHEYFPITPRYPPPKSPRASKYGQVEPNNNEDEFLASSPKSGRYSPVYSPETGRVKIKLTETARPKTPMLVTRSKSNAGDIITTPVRATQYDAPVVTAGEANGQIEAH